mgnify:CR=1 FL=1
MKTLEIIREEYLAKKAEIAKVEAKIIERRKQIDRLNKKERRLSDANWWVDALIRPVMELVKAKFPQLTWDDERLIPMGMGCRVHVFAKHNDKSVAYLAFSPDNGDGKLWFETGEVKEGYPSGSIGAMNGFDRVQKPLERIEELYSHIVRQLAEKE